MKDTKFKALWSSKMQSFVHFEKWPLSEEITWGYSNIPMLFGYNSTLEDIFGYLGGNQSKFPEGLELKNIMIKFD